MITVHNPQGLRCAVRIEIAAGRLEAARNLMRNNRWLDWTIELALLAEREAR